MATGFPKPKILCVDDEELILGAVTRLLQTDFTVLSAESAEAAYEIVAENPDIAIVLMDQQLPGISGVEFLAKVQQMLPDAVRAVLSGRLDLMDMANAINAAKIHRLILKPWDNDYFKVQMLEALAIHTTLREKRILEELSITDSVTHLKNHRYFQDRLKVEVERSTRHNRPLTLVMADIDFFKMLNDRYGHPVGDQILKGVAQRLVDQLRLIDTVARYGGEEFGLILPDTPFESAMMVAERIRLSFVKKPIGLPDDVLGPVSLSLGVAAVPDHAFTAQELIAQADAALYQAKRQGRNQTVGAQIRRTINS